MGDNNDNGSTTENPENPPGEGNPQNAEPASGESGETLGPAGMRALEAERAARKAAEKKARKVDSLESELAELRQAQLSDQERQIEQAKTEAAESARAEVIAETNKRLFGAEVRATATGVLADPSLLSDPDVALRLLELDEVPLDKSGNVDSEAISGAITKLVENKPYLSVGATRAPIPNVDQGARAASGVTQLARDALRNMSPYEIEKARQEGRLENLLRGT